MSDEKLELTEKRLLNELDRRIEIWRDMDANVDQKIGAVNVLQNLRSTFYGEMKECRLCGKTESHGHDIEDIRESFRKEE